MASKASALGTNMVISKTANDKKPLSAKALDSKNRYQLKLWTPKNSTLFLVPKLCLGIHSKTRGK